MLPSSEDKKNLIESMKKLTHHISNNSTRQKQIFDSLTKNDLLKIITNLTDDNQYLRRISGLFLAQLFYNNEEIKLRATKLLDICPPEGRICLNQIPQQIQKYPSTFKKCIQLMKSPIKQNQEDKFCWTINLDRKVLQIEYFDYKKYSSFTFLDPNRNIFGFTYVSKKRREEMKKNVVEQVVDNHSKEKSIRSIDSRGGSSKKQGTNSNIGSTFYKNYLEFRNRKGDSPSSYRQTYEKRDFNKLTTMNNNNNNTSRNHKNDYLGMSNNKTITTITNDKPNLTMSSSTRKQQQSHHHVMTPNKKDYRQYMHYNNNNKLNSPMNDSLELNTNMRSPVGSAHREAIYRETLTDRRNNEQTVKNRLNESEMFANSNTINDKFRPSVGNQTINKSPLSQQQDKYYKRVKEMLKR